MLTLLNSLLAKVLEGMQLLEAANENIHKPGIKRLARLLHINGMIIPSLGSISSVLTEEKQQTTLISALDSVVCLRPQYGRVHGEGR